MIGYVRKVRHMTYVVICCAYIRGFFESEHYINTVVVVVWVCLAPDRRVWKVLLNVVMSLQVV
jgi:hypothetical protein